MKYAIIEIDGEYYPAYWENGEYKPFKYGPFNLYTVKFEFQCEARDFIKTFHGSGEQLMVEEMEL